MPTQPQKEPLLGLGHPLNEIPELQRYAGQMTEQRFRFPNALEDWVADPLTLRERAMIAMMGRIMGKEGWEQKVFDGPIVGKWMQEGVSDSFSLSMFNYVSVTTERIVLYALGSSLMDVMCAVYHRTP